MAQPSVRPASFLIGFLFSAWLQIGDLHRRSARAEGYSSLQFCSRSPRWPAGVLPEMHVNRKAISGFQSVSTGVPTSQSLESLSHSTHKHTHAATAKVCVTSHAVRKRQLGIVAWRAQCCSLQRRLRPFPGVTPHSALLPRRASSSVPHCGLIPQLRGRRILWRVSHSVPTPGTTSMSQYYLKLNYLRLRCRIMRKNSVSPRKPLQTFPPNDVGCVPNPVHWLAN